MKVIEDFNVWMTVDPDYFDDDLIVFHRDGYNTRIVRHRGVYSEFTNAHFDVDNPIVRVRVFQETGYMFMLKDGTVLVVA
jgi:hypothetical protein